MHHQRSAHPWLGKTGLKGFFNLLKTAWIHCYNISLLLSKSLSLQDDKFSVSVQTKVFLSFLKDCWLGRRTWATVRRRRTRGISITITRLLRLCRRLGRWIRRTKVWPSTSRRCWGRVRWQKVGVVLMFLCVCVAYSSSSILSHTCRHHADFSISAPACHDSCYQYNSSDSGCCTSASPHLQPITADAGAEKKLRRKWFQCVKQALFNFYVLHF